MSESLTDFLLARIAEDEATAHEARSAYEAMPQFGETAFEVAHGLAFSEGAPRAALEHIARHDPARVLAECEAKRRIVERASVECVCTDHGSERVKDCPQCVACNAVTTADGYVLADLALPYASHPSYREEWRP